MFRKVVVVLSVMLVLRWSMFSSSVTNLNTLGHLFFFVLGRALRLSQSTHRRRPTVKIQSTCVLEDAYDHGSLSSKKIH